MKKHAELYLEILLYALSGYNKAYAFFYKLFVAGKARKIFMDHFTKAGEQYCCIVGHNVILEETEKNGKRLILHCMHEAECEKNGGCKNRYIKHLLTDKSK